MSPKDVSMAAIYGHRGAAAAPRPKNQHQADSQQLRGDIRELEAMNCTSLATLHNLERELRQQQWAAAEAQGRADAAKISQQRLHQELAAALSGPRTVPQERRAREDPEDDAKVRAARRDLERLDAQVAAGMQRIAELEEEVQRLREEEERKAPLRMREVIQLEQMNSLLVTENSLLIQKLSRVQALMEEEGHSIPAPQGNGPLLEQPLEEPQPE